jgi:anti-anti-sigma factor
MSLHIKQRDNEGIVILDLKSPLTLGHEDFELRHRLLELHQFGKVNIVLNLKHVSCIDSTGLGTLVFELTPAAQSRGTAGAAKRKPS